MDYYLYFSMNIDSILSKSNQSGTFNYVEGCLILVNKPLHWTSFDVVNKIRFALKHKLAVKKIKVGHAGTLDPLATGLLLVCTGKFTKDIDQLQNDTKSYSGIIKLGATTPTYDAESEPQNQTTVPDISPEMIQQLIHNFSGIIAQVPPIFSAIKIDGKKAYQLARRGEETTMKAREITIFSLEIIIEKRDQLFFRVHCSKGTYIRSLAHDIGQFLGCGAYLLSLHRESIGKYRADEAMELPDVISTIQQTVLK